MKNTHLIKTFSLLTILFFLVPALKAQQVEKWDAQSAAKWVKKNEWRKGLLIKLHSSTDKIAFATQYHRNEKIWDEAFKFLSRSDLSSLAPGKYPIDGDNVYASITEGPEKEFKDSKWESHRKYIDLQFVIKGKEKIGVAPLNSATITKPYSEDSEAANYTAEGKYYIATPRTFFLFFPRDAHRPNIKVDGYDVVKKLVIKIKVTD